ncbi:MAG: shikimate dehydrogenase, partial [Pseudomonadota bacterium]
MIKTAVIGHPVAHSKSPKIHSYWLQKYGLKGSYTAIDIAPENLAAGVRQLIADGYTGFNVTVPHKIAIMALCTTLSPAAQAIGAVNTVSVQKDGTLYGHNTDGFGFAANLDEALPLFDWSAGPAVVIGAGGAAHAILWALQE